jgi:hypothetical protein
MRRSTRWLLGILGILAVVSYCSVPVCPCEDWDFYEAEGEALYAGVLAYWATEGKLPKSLSSIKRRISERVASAWEYDSWQDPLAFSFSIGNYYLCGCTLYGVFRSKWDLDLPDDERPVKTHAIALLQAALQHRVEQGRFPASVADFASPVSEGWTFTPPHDAPDWYQPRSTIQEGKLEYHGLEGRLALVFQVFEWTHDT